MNMYLLYVGLTYKTTPVQLREQLTFFQPDLSAANQQLAQQKSILENVILSTCNRTEIYAVVDQLHTGRYYIKHFLANYFGVAPEILERYMVYKEEQTALLHCFQVGCGLDSMVLGETQILGQLKASFLTAQKSGTTGTIFNQLFKEMLTFSKRMHTQYAINQHSASLSQVALQIAKEKRGSLKNLTLFILGAGQMSELVIKNTQNFALGRICLFNRTLDRGNQLAATTSVAKIESYPLTAFYDRLAEADIVISALAVKTPWVTAEALQPAIRQRNRPLLLMDLGLPRNIQAQCADLLNVELCDLDDLNQLIEKNQQQRRAVTEKIQEEAKKAVLAFSEWERQLGIVPVIQVLREQALMAEEAAMASLVNKLPQLNQREIKIIRKHMKSIVNQMIRQPITEVKELSIQENAEYDIQLVKRIFGIQTADEEAAAGLVGAESLVGLDSSVGPESSKAWRKEKKGKLRK